MRRIEALTGAAADAWFRDRVALLGRASATAGAASPEVLPDRIAALQDELRETRRRLREGGGAAVPRPAELAQAAEEVAPGVRLVSRVAPYDSIDTLKGAARDVRGVLGSGIIALGLDSEEPQIFVTVSEDLVAKGIAAGDLVRLAVPSIDGRGGGRPEMAQGKGARREGLAAALEAIRDAVRANGATGG
jgi:alanyl-tRNA synthetase